MKKKNKTKQNETKFWHDLEICLHGCVQTHLKWLSCLRDKTSFMKKDTFCLVTSAGQRKNSERNRTSILRFRFLMRIQNFFFVLRSWLDEKNISPYFFTELKNLLSFSVYKISFCISYFAFILNGVFFKN